MYEQIVVRHCTIPTCIWVVFSRKLFIACNTAHTCKPCLRPALARCLREFSPGWTKRAIKRSQDSDEHRNRHCRVQQRGNFLFKTGAIAKEHGYLNVGTRLISFARMFAKRGGLAGLQDIFLETAQVTWWLLTGCLSLFEVNLHVVWFYLLVNISNNQTFQSYSLFHLNT